MILTRDLQTPIGYYAAGSTVQVIDRRPDAWVIRLQPGWTVTVAPDMLRAVRRTTRSCIACQRETFRRNYCPDCETIIARMQAIGKAA